MTYDPIFDMSKRPPADHEHIWKQTGHRLFESCCVPGCSIARYSRAWIDSLQQRRSAESAT